MELDQPARDPCMERGPSACTRIEFFFSTGEAGRLDGARRMTQNSYSDRRRLVALALPA